MELEYQQNYLAEGQPPNHPLSSLVQTEPLPQPLMLGLRQLCLFNTLDFFSPLWCHQFLHASNAQDHEFCSEE